MKHLATATIIAGWAFTCPVAAKALTINNTDGTFHNPVGGTSVVITDAPTGSTIRWGIPSTQRGSQSGLRFNGTATGVVTPLVDFLLGDLTHFNQPIASGTAASGVDLAISLAMTGTVPTPVNFGFGLVIDETPNRTPCTYVSTRPCADKITILDPAQEMTFSDANGVWTLDLFFRDMEGASVDSFISQEGRDNTAQLYGRFVAPKPKDPDTVPGPLPLLGVGSAFAWSRRLRRRIG
jgi:hypothetical protein